MPNYSKRCRFVKQKQNILFGTGKSTLLPHFVIGKGILVATVELVPFASQHPYTPPHLSAPMGPLILSVG